MAISSATMQKDVYKEYHVRAYHPQVSKVYVNFTSRSGKLSNVKGNKEVVFVGLQYFIKDYLQEEWDTTFFNLPKEEAIGNHKRVLSGMLGYEVDGTYLEELHTLGYLPLHIKALPEGTSVPYQVPVITIENTLEGFQWLPNMIETVMSCENWPIQTSATTASAYYKNFKDVFEETGVSQELLPFMGHDFSFRGMMGRQAAAMSGFGHLCSGFAGTDTIPAVLFAEKYYGADVGKELVGCSCPATEHSVTCSSILVIEEELAETGRYQGVMLDEILRKMDNIKLAAEYLYYKGLMETTTPSGILSLVADSYDFWSVVSKVIPSLKEEIMNRDGKVVIRPDSGDPVEVLCGVELKILGDWYDGTSFDAWKESVAYEMDEEFCSNLDAEDPHCSETTMYTGPYGTFEVTYEPDLNRHDKTYYYVDNWGSDVSKCKFEEQELTSEQKGLVECLWDTFGGTVTEKGYKLLDDHIGAIYGDAITLERQKEIFRRLKGKGFAPTVVLGIGSYSYQYVTRDTHGSAVKATNVVKGGEDIPIFKDPKTDTKKKSAKGLLRVDRGENGTLVCYDQQTRDQEKGGLLEDVFIDGKLVRETTLSEIREITTK